MPPKFDLKPVVAAAKVAARRTADTLRQSLGLTTDPDVRLYNRLQPDDFAEMRRRYGDQDLWGYIQTMEQRRLGRKAPESALRPRNMQKRSFVPPPIQLQRDEPPGQARFKWAEGQYTQAALTEASFAKTYTPSSNQNFLPGAGGYFVSGGENNMSLVAVRRPELEGPQTSQHEYGHYFDAMHDRTKGEFAGAVQKEFEQGNMLAWNNFPGMFGNPPAPFPNRPEGWGGIGELYAEMNVRPWDIPPKLWRFFPQFNSTAYKAPAQWSTDPDVEPSDPLPPGYDWEWVTFEDGSGGWSMSKKKRHPDLVR